ncbi:hypothetical protein MRB53_016093 [Persea americana]|uniref:Uncharacterized protein n=1 Tax=Persea americana TaxID=3435 RepID=A0ACC2M126_PERAE|nr:hypothetical protein MRB53_016093 [Persea americana]
MTWLEQQMEMLIQHFQAFMANQNHQNHNAHDAGDDFEESDDSQEAPTRRRRVLDPPIEDRRRWEAGLHTEVQIQDTVNLFDPVSVSAAHQRALQVEKQLMHRSNSGVAGNPDTDDGEEDDAYVGEEPAFDDTPDEEILEVNRSSGFSPFQVVYSMIPRGPLDLIPLPSKIRAHGKVAEFVDGLQAIHKKVHDNLVQAATKYKMLADKKRHHVEFEVGDFVWAVLIKDRFSVGNYNKLSAKKIGPVEIIEKINPNAYCLKLPNHIRTADVFNVKHLIPDFGDSSDDDATGNSR